MKLLIMQLYKLYKRNYHCYLVSVWGGSTLPLLLTTVTPKMMTNNRDANPITIPAIAHCGKNTSSSAYPTVGTTCFASTATERYKPI
jgi:hypothetical protein